MKSCEVQAQPSIEEVPGKRSRSLSVYEVTPQVPRNNVLRLCNWNAPEVGHVINLNQSTAWVRRQTRRKYALLPCRIEVSVPANTFSDGIQGTVPANNFCDGIQGSVPANTFCDGIQGSVPANPFSDGTFWPATRSFEWGWTRTGVGIDSVNRCSTLPFFVDAPRDASLSRDQHGGGDLLQHGNLADNFCPAL